MKKVYGIFIGGGVVFTLIIVIVAVTLWNTEDDSESAYANPFYTSCDNPKSSNLGTFEHAAISTDAVHCGTIAIDILKQNGTAADAAIAAMFCVGVINAQSSGLGGGFLATYYSRESGKVYALDAREVAPKAANWTMYNPELNPELKETKRWYQRKPSANMKGGLSVAVPGELSGLYALYKKFGGGVPWKELLEPTIKLCLEGYNLTWYTGGIIKLMKADILAEPSMSIFKDAAQERLLDIGEKVYRKKLAETLRILQDDPEALYKGSLADDFIRDLKGFGGIITKEDMMEYKPKWRKAVAFNLNNGNYTLHAFPPPSSGLVVGLSLSILDAFNLTKSSLEDDEAIRTQLALVEAFKYSYAQRFQMGDLDQQDADALASNLTSEDLAFSLTAEISAQQMTSQDPAHYGTQVVPDPDQGTAHLSLIAPNGDAVSITSSINYGLGAGIRSESTGIIYNNEMADFTTDIKFKKPGSMKMKNNLIRPGKRPLSSMSPTIIVDGNGDVRLVLGAAGGVKIPSAIVWVAARHLWMGQDLKEAIDACRTHHSLLPMKLQYEKGFPKNVLAELTNYGHEIKEHSWKSVVQAVARQPNGEIVANSDYRKSGEIAGF